ncbi:hypothetical protein QEN19_000477 [Hanseniaspora menglaensis]
MNPELKSENLQKLIFWSHGGPTFAIKDDPFGCAGAFNKVESLGEKIKNEFKPDYVVVISAHWQPDYNTPDSLSKLYLSDTKKEAETENELIYDFYNFPQEMYSWKFKNTFSKDLIKRISALQEGTGISVEAAIRGLDHGLWVPGKVAKLDKPDNEGNLVPVVQLSMLPNSPALGGDGVEIRETLDSHYKLGVLINKIRADNGLVVLSGMSVHNLREIQSISRGTSSPEFKKFNDYLRTLIIADKKEKIAQDYNTNSLYKGLMKLGEDENLIRLLLKAHAPGIDHFLPFVIGAGSLTRDEYFKEVFNQETGSLGWGIYINKKIE